METSKENQGGRITIGTVLIAWGFFVLMLGSVWATVVATTPYSVIVSDVNGNAINAGSIIDASTNYTSQETAMSNSYFSATANFTSNTTMQTYDTGDFPYMKPGFLSKNMGITTAQIHQACQSYYGYLPTSNGATLSGNNNYYAPVDAGGFPYTPTYRSWKGVKYAVCVGDSLTQGTDATWWTLYGTNATTTYNEGPNGGDWPDQLGETFFNWATIPIVNQGHGGLGLLNGIGSNATSRYAGEIQPYKPQAGAHAIMIIWLGTNDGNIGYGGSGYPTAAQFETGMTSYITQAHADGFYPVVLCNIPNINSSWSTSGTYPSNPWRTAVNTYEAGTGCGQDISVNLDSVITGVSGYVASSPTPNHLNNSGYAAVAAAINSALSNP